MPGSRATKAQIEERVAMVFAAMVQGKTTRQIWHYVAQSTDWGISRRTLAHYVAAAREQLAAMCEVDKEHELGLARTRLEDLYSRCYGIQDFGECRRIEADRRTFLGLDRPTRISVEGELTSEELNRLTSEQLLDIRAGKLDAQTARLMLAAGTHDAEPTPRTTF